MSVMMWEWNSTPAVHFINNDLWTIALGQIHNLRVSNLPSNSPFGKPQGELLGKLLTLRLCIFALRQFAAGNYLQFVVSTV